MKASIQGVLFDLDGTLIDSSQGFTSAINAVLHELELPSLCQTVISSEVSLGARGLLHKYLPEQSTENYQHLRGRFLAHFEQVVAEQFCLYPGVAEAIDWLDQEGIAWGVVTNKPLRLAEPTLAKLNWRGCRILICPEHVQAPKPSGEGILLACQALGLPPSQVVYVGDHQHDVLAARAAGSLAVATGWGLRPALVCVHQWQADAVFPTPEQLTTSLMELFAQ